MSAYLLSNALRQVRRAPFISTINLLALALGIACFLTAWAIANFWSMSDQHFDHIDRIEVMTQQYGSDGSGTGPHIRSAAPLAKYLREDFPELEAVARLAGTRSLTLVAGDRKANLSGSLADPDLLDIFNFDFIYGQPNDALDAPNSIILFKYAAERLFGESNPIGESILIGEDELWTVTGVLEPIQQPSHFGHQADAIFHLDYLRTWPAPDEDDNNERWLGTVGTTYALLPEDNSLSKADFRRELAALAKRRVPQNQLNVIDMNFDAISLNQVQVRHLDTQLFKGNTGLLSVISVIFGLGLIVLIVSCINYANLATAQAAGQAKEVGMHKVLGAGKLQIFLQYWSEAIILTVVAALLALISISLVSPLVFQYTNIDIVSIIIQNPASLLLLLLLIPIVSLAASAYPSLFLANTRPVQALRSGKVKSGSRLLSGFLVGAQFAIASALLILVVIVNQQNNYLRQSVLSEQADPVAILIDTGSTSIGLRNLATDLVNEPSIKGFSTIDYMPWSAHQNFLDLAHSREQGVASTTVYVSYTGYDFLDLFDAEIIAGRDYNPELDTEENSDWRTSEEVPIIIDERLSSQLGYASPHAAVDQLVYFSRQLSEAFGERDPTFRIIGVSTSIPLVFNAGKVTGNVYALDAALNDFPMIRIDNNRVAEGIAAIERVVQARMPNSVVQMKFADAEFERNFRTFEGINLAFTGLSMVAFAIASMGLFGMALYIANRRRHEIGVRKTLGASVAQIMTLLLADFSKPVFIANLIAWPIAWIAARVYLNSFMQRIELTLWPWVFGLVITVFIAWFAVGSQAWRAARVKPAEVLKDE